VTAETRTERRRRRLRRFGAVGAVARGAGAERAIAFSGRALMLAGASPTARPTDQPTTKAPTTRTSRRRKRGVSGLRGSMRSSSAAGRAGYPPNEGELPLRGLVPSFGGSRTTVRLAIQSV